MEPGRTTVRTVVRGPGVGAAVVIERLQAGAELLRRLLPARQIDIGAADGAADLRDIRGDAPPAPPGADQALPDVGSTQGFAPPPSTLG